mmetsp:Transcript_16290/g.37517  ORF Transcript_16290/g.37517 Transcript_16290/m.37517 type:complete len:249 (-) Transcript_16290:460-1206(-)
MHQMLANREMVGLRDSKGVSGRKNSHVACSLVPLDEIRLEIQDDTQVLHEVATKNEIIATISMVKDKRPELRKIEVVEDKLFIRLETASKGNTVSTLHVSGNNTSWKRATVDPVRGRTRVKENRERFGNTLGLNFVKDQNGVRDNVTLYRGVTGVSCVKTVSGGSLMGSLSHGSSIQTVGPMNFLGTFIGIALASGSIGTGGCKSSGRLVMAIAATAFITVASRVVINMMSFRAIKALPLGDAVFFLG